MHAFVLSFGIIFVAELGDKSQLMALAFAARYRAVPILVGISIATAVVHAVSVGIGAAVGVALPTRAITALAGVAFLGFAAWTLRGDVLGEDDTARVNRSERSAIVAASVAFFLAELGTPGVIVESGPTKKIFSEPVDPRTADYVNGRFG